MLKVSGLAGTKQTNLSAIDEPSSSPFLIENTEKTLQIKLSLLDLFIWFFEHLPNVKHNSNVSELLITQEHFYDI
jgi:hypothetical protein